MHLYGLPCQERLEYPKKDRETELPSTNLRIPKTEDANRKRAFPRLRNIVFFSFTLPPKASYTRPDRKLFHSS